MKKIIVGLLILSCLCSCFCFSNLEKTIYSIFGNFDVVRVCVVDDKEWEDDDDSISSVVCGDKIFHYGTFDEIKNRDLNFDDVDSIQFYIVGATLSEIEEKLGGEIVFSEKIDEKNVTYLFVSCWKKSVAVENKKVNCQIVERENDIVVAFPMILTSY